MILVGIIALKAELKAINSSLTVVLVIRMLHDAYKAREMASAIDLLQLYANCNGSSLSGRLELMCNMISLSKPFIMEDVRATRWRSLRHVSWFGGHRRLVQGEFKDVHEYCQLVCAGFEHIAGDSHPDQSLRFTLRKAYLMSVIVTVGTDTLDTSVAMI